MAASPYILRASGAPGWGNCSAWLAANAHKPNIDTPESLAGTAAHWVAHECLEGFRGGKSDACANWIWRTDPDGTVIDEAMAEGAQIMVDDTIEFAARHGQVLSMMLEHRVHMPRIHKQNGGTFDAGMIVPDKKLIFVSDYKHGRVQVDPFNLQNIDYVGGLIQELPGVPDTDVTVVMRVVQPNCFTAQGPVREWVGMLSELRPSFNRLHNMGHESLTNPKATAGPTQCRFCYGRKDCKTFKNSVYGTIDRMDEPFITETMTAADLGTEYELLKDGLALVKGRADAIEEELKFRIKNGETGSGKTLETSIGHRAWTIPPAQAAAIGRQFGVDLAVEKVQTPTQAKASVPKALRDGFEEVLKTVTERPVKGLKLIDAKDSLSARAFGRKQNNATT